MAFNDAATVAGMTLVISVGLQFIGHAQHAARMAHMRWTTVDAPATANLLESFRQETEATVHGMREARTRIRAAAQQIRDEVS